jgi:hypothetical protein
MEAMMGMDVDDELEATQESVKKEDVVEVKRELGARKKRKVKVTVQEMNHRGYMGEYYILVTGNNTDGSSLQRRGKGRELFR